MGNNDNVSYEYKPISMWGYFGYELLFSIPLVGFIALLICAFGSSNKNVKNFARSYFCFLILVVVIVAVLVAIAAATGALAEIADLIG